MLKKEYFEFNIMVSEKLEKKIKELSFDNLYVDKKIDEHFVSVKNDNSDFKKFLIETSNQRINGVKETLSEEYNNLFKKLSDSLDSKMNIIKKDDVESKSNNDIAAEGRVQGYIIEAEKRIKKNIEERVDKIQQTVEKINIKLNVSEFK